MTSHPHYLRSCSLVQPTKYSDILCNTYEFSLTKHCKAQYATFGVAETLYDISDILVTHSFGFTTHCKAQYAYDTYIRYSVQHITNRLHNIAKPNMRPLVVAETGSWLLLLLSWLPAPSLLHVSTHTAIIIFITMCNGVFCDEDEEAAPSLCSGFVIVFLFVLGIQYFHCIL